MRAAFIATGLIAVVTAQNTSSPCVTGNAVHMIVARASEEAPGTGVIGNVSTRVADQLPGSNVVAVDYPATLSNYQSSQRQGVTAMMALVMSYSSQCPNSRMVLMGYSQGAHVAADVLCGTTENNFNTSQALSTNIMNKVAAVVLMGDPSKAANETFLQGTSTKDGIFPRTNTAACESIKSRIASFCNANDTFCDSGSSIPVHLSYVQNNGTSAVNFIMQKVRADMSSGKSNGTVSTNAAVSAFKSYGSSSVFTSGLGMVSLGLGFLFMA